MKDYVRIFWGTPPNLFTPYGTDGYGPYVYIEVGGEEVQLVWNPDTEMYESDASGFDITLSKEDGSWCLTEGSFEFCFEPGNFTCQTFPEGYAFIRFGGPPVDYEIIRYQHHIDDRGAYHHTTLHIEFDDVDGQITQ